MATLITARADSLARYLNPLAMLRSLWQQRSLTYQFVKREISGRYKGSNLGIFWSAINPIVLLLIYTFVFGVVFQMRWPQAGELNLSEFAMVLFCGLIPFNLFNECVARAPSLIVSNPNYVKKVVFPVEILPLSILGSALFHGAISLVILLIFWLVLVGTLPFTLVLLPLVLLPLMMVALGLAWFLASLGVFVRDITYTVGLLLQVTLFATPIFYPSDAVPDEYRWLIELNPLTPMVENFRNVTLWGLPPDWGRLAIQTIVSAVMMLLGYAWFMKTKKAFADVL